MVETPLLLAGLATTLVLLACSAFFSSTETAMFSLTPEWISSQADSSAGASSLAELRGDPHRLLVTLLVGNNVVNIAIASVVTVLVGSSLSPGPAVVVTTVVVSVVVLLFGEIVPKSYGLGNAKQWAVRMAPAFRIVELVLWPAIVAFDHLTRRVAARLGAHPEIERPYLD
jgi:Mg2+/Co2+ transporter CorB